MRLWRAVRVAELGLDAEDGAVAVMLQYFSKEINFFKIIGAVYGKEHSESWFYLVSRMLDDMSFASSTVWASLYCFRRLVTRVYWEIDYFYVVICSISKLRFIQ
jgi:hypothetical protein